VAPLLAPIPGDDPAGEPLPFDIRNRLSEARKETSLDEQPEGTGEPPKRADWPGIIRLATDTLINTSKDLLVVTRLTEALVKLHGFAGLRRSLELLLGMVEECWDRMHPVIEEGDVTPRAGHFNWLDAPTTASMFPTTLRLIPLVGDEREGYGCEDFRPSDAWAKQTPREKLDKALMETDAQDLVDHVTDLKESRALLERLVAVLYERMGAEAPALAAVRQAVEEGLSLASELAQRKGPVPGLVEETVIEDTNGDGEETGPRPPRTAATRAEAYRQLHQAAALLQELEPHSPIPYLVRRAVELGALPFPLLMKALIRNEDVLLEMNRELGIREPESES